MAKVPPTNPVQSHRIDPHAFFNLSPVMLAKALKAAIPSITLTDDQDIYLDTVLVNVANTATTVMQQEGTLSGTFQARTLSPAASMARVGPYESSLYKLINEGKVDEVKSITKPQTFTFTTHPNFSRSRDLTLKCKELAIVLGNLRRKDQQKIVETGTLPDNPAIGTLLGEVSELINLRTKRSRADELQETTLDMIPTVMEGASEQMRILSKRAAILSNPHKPLFTGWRIDNETNKTVKTFINGPSLKRLEAAAALLPEYNSWFLDGDGKRTVHAYDGEYAIPAIKRATYEEYARLLDKLPKQLDGANIEAVRNRLNGTIKVLAEVEKRADARMNAFNKLHETYRAREEDSQDPDRSTAYNLALKAAEKCSMEYDNFIHRKIKDIDEAAADPMKRDAAKEKNEETVIDLMKRDDAAFMKKTIGALLQKSYDNTLILDPEQKKNAEDLFVKLTHFGNFAVHIQRRENAKEYDKVFKYLVQNNLHIKKVLSDYLGVSEADILAKLDNPVFYSQAVEVFSKNAMAPDDPLMIRHPQNGLLGSYKRLSAKLEKTLIGQNGTVKEEKAMSPLEERELLTLDDLSMFRMASIYPEAFKGGFVIAEFGQPDTDTLRGRDTNQIKAEVARVSKNDLLLQLGFAHAMGAPNVEIIPLHEDPSTMQYAADAQPGLRSESIVEYMKKWIGATTAEEAKKKSLHYIDDEKGPQQLTAYQYMQRFGYSDDELRKKELDPEILKKTYVLEGPHDMEACSDNNKRAGIMGSELADHSVRDKLAAVAKLPVKIGDKNYIIVKPKYLGQGGSTARAVEVPLDTGQCTRQGEHIASLTPQSLAHKCYDYMLGRLYLGEEAARGLTFSNELRTLSDQFPHIGNILGLPGVPILDDDRRQMLLAIDKRLASTRDDNRYNGFLQKYGEPVSNYSARSDAKGGVKAPLTFNSGRAIGLAGNEFGIFSNIIAFGEMFATDGSSINRMREWKKNDPMMQQIITVAALTANFVDLKQKWLRGGIEYKEHNGVPYLYKIKKKGPNQGKQAVIDLKTLTDAYDANEESYKDARTGITFDSGDLVMAHLTDQYHRMVKGLQELYIRENPLEFLPSEQREDIKYFADLNNRILDQWHKTKDFRKIGEDPEEERPDLKNQGRLALDAYYLLHESGSIYPMPALLEQGIFAANIVKKHDQSVYWMPPPKDGAAR